MVSLVCAAYNFIPSKHLKESPFIMFGHDPVLPLNTLLQPKVHIPVAMMEICSL